MPALIIYYPPKKSSIITTLRTLAENDHRSLSSYLRKVLDRHVKYSRRPNAH